MYTLPSFSRSGITALLLLFAVTLCFVADTRAAGRKKSGRSAGTATYRGPLGFKRGSSTSNGRATTYQAGRLGPALTATRNGKSTSYTRRGLFKRNIEVGRATQDGNVTSYTMPGLFGKQREVGRAVSTSSGVMYQNRKGRTIGSAESTASGSVYRNRRGKTLYRADGQTNPRQDGFVELYRRQQEAMWFD